MLVLLSATKACVLYRWRYAAHALAGWLVRIERRAFCVFYPDNQRNGCKGLVKVIIH